MDPNIVILAGGISSRMRKLSGDLHSIDKRLLQEAQEKNKAMLSVGQESSPFLDYVLFNIQGAGYKNVVIIVGENDDSIRDYYDRQGGSGHFKQLSISYVLQPIPAGRAKPLGTADALLRALRSLPEWRGHFFTVCNSDNLYSQEALRALLEIHHMNALIDYDRSALQFEDNRISQFAVLKKDQEGFLIDIIEKPDPEQVKMVSDGLGRIGVSMNIFRFSYDTILPFLESVPLHPVRQEQELPEAVRLMVRNNQRWMIAIPFSEHVPDLTNPTDILRVQEYLRTEFKHSIL